VLPKRVQTHAVSIVRRMANVQVELRDEVATVTLSNLRGRSYARG
jgi:hypothetical protein